MADVEVVVLFFAKSRELAGLKTAKILIESPTNLLQVVSTIVSQFPSLQVIADNLVVSVNEDYLQAGQEVHLNAGDEVAVIPPISGGMDHVEVTEDTISADHTTNLVSSPSCGAISVFIGTTRDNFDGKQVLRLEYEAYVPMAKKKMMEICQQIHEKWDVHKVAMIHRIGVVPVEEASIVIAVSSSHRKESLEAVGYAIDTVKAVVPIWKKEIYGDESSAWKENKECTWTVAS